MSSKVTFCNTKSEKGLSQTPFKISKKKNKTKQKQKQQQQKNPPHDQWHQKKGCDLSIFILWFNITCYEVIMMSWWCHKKKRKTKNHKKACKFYYFFKNISHENSSNNFFISSNLVVQQICVIKQAILKAFSKKPTDRFGF